MKKLLATLAVSFFTLGIIIIGRPINKGEDFFIINYGNDTKVLYGVVYKDGNLKGWNEISKEKANEMFKKWKLGQKKDTSA